MQAEALHGEWKSEKAQRISLTERIIKQGTELTDEQLQHQAAVVRIGYVCMCFDCPLPRQKHVPQVFMVFNTLNGMSPAQRQLLSQYRYVCVCSPSPLARKEYVLESRQTFSTTAA